MHVRFSNVFDHYRNVEIPCSDRLVVGRCNEPPVFVNEGDCVDRTKMLVVFLNNFTRVNVILYHPGISLVFHQ